MASDNYALFKGPFPPPYKNVLQYSHILLLFFYIQLFKSSAVYFYGWLR